MESNFAETFSGNRSVCGDFNTGKQWQRLAQGGTGNSSSVQKNTENLLILPKKYIAPDGQ